MKENRFVLSLATATARILPVPVKQALYRFPPLARLIRSSLNRAAPQGLTLVTIASGGLVGMRMELDLQDEKDYWLGTYEVDLQTAIKEWVKPGFIAYDVGANIGYIALLLARAVRPGGHVYAFEALPVNFERLERNLAENSMTSTITALSKAVADRLGLIRFMIGPSGGMGKVEGSAGRDGFEYKDAISIQAISLDAFVYEERKPTPQVIKIDIEGGEVLAIPGMKRILAEARPLIFLELHGPEAARVAWQHLSSLGYQICQLKPGYPRIPSFERLDWKAYVLARPV